MSADVELYLLILHLESNLSVLITKNLLKKR